jgi:hypothetical protein
MTTEQYMFALLFLNCLYFLLKTAWLEHHVNELRLKVKKLEGEK